MGRTLSATAATLMLCALLCALPRRAAAQPVMWRTVRTGGVVVHYPTTLPEAQLQDLLDSSAQARKDVQKWFGEELRERLEMRVYPDTPSYVSTTDAPWWHAAVWKGSTLHIQPPRVLAERGALYTTLIHEYTHMAMDQFAGKQLPLWFAEGLSTLISGEFSNLVKGKESEHVWRGSLVELDGALTQMEKPEPAQAAYHGAFLLVRDLEAQYTRDMLLEFLKDIKKGGVFDAKFKVHFKTTPPSMLAAQQKKYPHKKQK